MNSSVRDCLALIVLVAPAMLNAAGLTPAKSNQDRGKAPLPVIALAPSMQRGGGPTDQPSVGSALERARRGASVHIVATETALRAARDATEGIDWLFAVSGSSFTPEYARDLGSMTESARLDLNTARMRLTQLRSSAVQVEPASRVDAEFSQAERSVDQARQALDHVHVRSASATVNELSQARSYVDTLQTGLRDAETALQHIEHELE